MSENSMELKAIGGLCKGVIAAIGGIMTLVAATGPALAAGEGAPHLDGSLMAL